MQRSKIHPVTLDIISRLLQINSHPQKHLKKMPTIHQQYRIFRRFKWNGPVLVPTLKFQDSAGHSFNTRLENVFVIGQAQHLHGHLESRQCYKKEGTEGFLLVFLFTISMIFIPVHVHPWSCLPDGRCVHITGLVWSIRLYKDSSKTCRHKYLIKQCHIIFHQPCTYR